MGGTHCTLSSFVMLRRSSSGHADSADDPADGCSVEAGGPGPEDDPLWLPLHRRQDWADRSSHALRYHR